jgi:hypothetical protein
MGNSKMFCFVDLDGNVQLVWFITRRAITIVYVVLLPSLEQALRNRLLRHFLLIVRTTLQNHPSKSKSVVFPDISVNCGSNTK